MTEYRSLADMGASIELRSDGDGRTISGIAVPWNRPTKINDRLVESFAPGAFSAQLRAATRVPLALGHMRQGGHLIGRVTELRDDQAGLYMEARISPTSVGNDTLELIKDGALDQLSIGFNPLRNEQVRGVTVRTAARLFEIAVVPEGAYGDGAVIAGVRAADAELMGDIAEVGALALAEAEEEEEESRSNLAAAREYIRALGYLPREFRAS